MGLGNTDITNFKPQSNGTAKTLITTFPQQENKKKDRPIHIRIESDVLEVFEEISKANGKDVSKALRAYINAVVASGHL